MFKDINKKAIAIALGAALILTAGCGNVKSTVVESVSTIPESVSSTESTVTTESTEVSADPAVSESQNEEDPNGVYVIDVDEAELTDSWEIGTVRYYSADESFYLWQDRENGKSVLVDGDLKLSLSVADGAYGAYVAKNDIDGDGEQEYLISECEGSGSQFCIYGLCIVDKEGEGYSLKRFDSTYFSDILMERVTLKVDPETHEMTPMIDGEVDPKREKIEVQTPPEEGAIPERFDLYDIIHILFTDGMPRVEVPAAVHYVDNNIPCYDTDYILLAPIVFDEQGNATLGEITSEMNR